MRSKTKLPIVYDQHDLMSFQRSNFSKKKKYWRKFCLDQANALIFFTEYYRQRSFELYNLNQPYVILPNMIAREVTAASLPEVQKLSKQALEKIILIQLIAIDDLLICHPTRYH